MSDKINIDGFGDPEKKEVVVAFDTSNYTTSVAVVDILGNIIADRRKILKVKSGERGLRQSEALFQHVVNLPKLIEEIFEKTGNMRIFAVAASNRPRSVEGSYMPVFLAGEGMARSMAASIGVPVHFFSHQEGHISVARSSAGYKVKKDSKGLAFHLSGGTCEIILTKGNIPIDIVGGTKDISFGQLIDRVGVALGMRFPSGADMDQIALSNKDYFTYHYSRNGNIVTENQILPKIHLDGSFANLSGIETAAQRAVLEGVSSSELITELFLRISDAIYHMILNASEETGTENITFAGGVSASRFLQYEIITRMKGKDVEIYFSDPHYSIDNAVGIALSALNI